MMQKLPAIVVLIAAALSLVLGPIVLMLYLGSTPGMLVAGGLIFFGAAGLWIGMKALAKRNTQETSDLL